MAHNLALTGTAYFSNLGLFIIPIGDPAYSEPVSYFEAIAATTSPGTSPTPTATTTPTFPPTAQDIALSNPAIDLTFYLLVCGVLLFLAIVAFAVDTRLGIGFGLIGIMISAYISSTGEILISRTVDVSLNVTTYNYLDFSGWGIMVLMIPFILSLLNLFMPILHKK
jgi:hypothetical protein